MEAIRHFKPNLDLIYFLIQGGCNVNAPSFPLDSTPLMHALLNGQKQVALLLSLADCDPLPCQTIMSKCFSHLDEELVQILFSHIQRPFSLQDSCRRRIRKALNYGQRYAWKVGQLSIPEAMKEFLLFAGIHGDTPWKQW